MPSKRELEELYWDKGLSLPELAKIYGVSVKTVWRWMKKHGIPRRERDKAKFDKYWKSERPVNLENKADLAYILGVMYGDGSLVFNPKTYGYILKLACKDEAFAKSFADALRRMGISPYVWHSKKSGIWEVRAINKKLWMLVKSAKDDESLKLLRELIRDHEIEFVRGFYESEGKSKVTAFVNTNRNLLEFVSQILEKHGFKTTISSIKTSGNRKPLYVLYVLGGKSSRRRFLALVNPCIKNGGV